MPYGEAANTSGGIAEASDNAEIATGRAAEAARCTEIATGEAAEVTDCIEIATGGVAEAADCIEIATGGVADTAGEAAGGAAAGEYPAVTVAANPVGSSAFPSLSERTQARV